ncbi:MAG: TonB-dependent receptor [Bacteroides sp.]|nr:TonB-dependent receptor [Bacteroides sp.]
MKFRLLPALLLYAAYSYSATPVKGVVIDSKTNEEIISATILIKEIPSKGTVTGLDGSFVINDLDGDVLTLNCSYIGYKTTEVKLNTPGADKITILLEPAAELLEKVIVYGTNTGSSDNGARTLEKNSMNVMNIVSARAIEISPDMTVVNIIQRISGVTVERNNSGDGQYAILRGMDKRYNYTLVNGVKIPSPDNKNRFVPLDIFPSELLERLDVSKALTADMEGDGIGRAINLVMKDAPSRRQLTANISTGYNALFLIVIFSLSIKEKLIKNPTMKCMERTILLSLQISLLQRLL